MEHESEIAEAITRIIGQKDVQQMTNLSRTTLWRMEREGHFPRRLRLSNTRVGWKAQEVVEWIESRPRGAA